MECVDAQVEELHVAVAVGHAGKPSDLVVAIHAWHLYHGFVIDPDTDYGRNPPPSRVSAFLSLVLPKARRPKELLILKGSNHVISLVRNPFLCFALLKDLSTNRETPFIRHLADDLAVIISRHTPELTMHRSSWGSLDIILN